jgi:hypothetical protein
MNINEGLDLKRHHQVLELPLLVLKNEVLTADSVVEFDIFICRHEARLFSGTSPQSTILG